jgi:hypothetical protein
MPSDFGEEDHSDMILQQDGAKRLQIFTLLFGMSWIKVSTQKNWQQRPYHSAISLP